MEQACTSLDAAPPPGSSLSLQQSQQVLGVLQEAFSAVMFHLQQVGSAPRPPAVLLGALRLTPLVFPQVDPSRFSEPFVLASFRALCSWLAEETSCLKEEVTALLPFLVDYARRHLQEGPSGRGLSDWMAQVSVSEEGGVWTGEEALR